MNKKSKFSQDKIVLLDSIRSAENVGAIFRTADAAGFSQVNCCGITPAPVDRFQRINNKVAKSALGAEKILAWKRKESCVKTLKKLLCEGYIVIAVEQSDKAISMSELKKKYRKTKKLALVLGSETDGVSARVLKLCNDIVELPMLGSKESLNVSVAFGVVAYSLLV